MTYTGQPARGCLAQLAFALAAYLRRFLLCSRTRSMSRFCSIEVTDS